MSFQPSLEFATRQYESSSALSDSGVPGGPPPDAAAGVGERPTSSAARRPSTPPTRATYTQKPYNSRRVFKLGGRVGHVSRHLRQLFKVKRANGQTSRLQVTHKKITQSKALTLVTLESKRPLIVVVAQ